jgi:hypothetical protein
MSPLDLRRKVGQKTGYIVYNFVNKNFEHVAHRLFSGIEQLSSLVSTENKRRDSNNKKTHQDPGAMFCVANMATMLKCC